MNDRQLLSEGRFIDGVILFTIANRLLKPFNKWDAYKMGIIDEKGNKVRDPENSKEKDAWSLLNRFIAKIKKALSSKILAGLAIYYTLIKEERANTLSKEEILEGIQYRKRFSQIDEKVRDVLLVNGVTEEEYHHYLVDRFYDDVE